MKIRYLIVLGLAGCNSTEENIVNVPAVVPTTITAGGNVITSKRDPSYEKLNSKSGATIQLTGTALQSIDNGAAASIFFKANGSLKAEKDGAFVLTDYATVTDANGFEQEGNI